MSTLPLALSKKWRARGKDLGTGGAERLRILGCEVALLRGPPDRIPFPGPGPRDATSHRCDSLRFVTMLDRLIKLSATELAEESPCARMRIIPRREDWRPRAMLRGSNGILRCQEHPRMNKHEREQRSRGLRGSVKRGGEERMRFAGIDIGGERHAVAVVNVLGNGNLPSPRRITG
jgi:hypothetical protein